MSLLRQTLQGLCCGTGWSYSVFWKVKQCNRIILIYEDGFNEFAGPKAHQNLATLGDFNCELLGTLVAKMSYHYYSFGEGLIGRVAFTGKHQWIFSPALTSIAGSSRPTPHEKSARYPTGWQEQFDAGMKTIALVAVPGGVVQLGSVDLVQEDLGLVSRIRSMFTSLQKVPGAFLSDLVSSMPGQMPSFAAASCPQPAMLPGSVTLRSFVSPPLQNNLVANQPMLMPPRVSLSELIKHPPARQVLASTAARQVQSRLEMGGAMDSYPWGQQKLMPQAGSAGTCNAANVGAGNPLLQPEGAVASKPVFNTWKPVDTGGQIAANRMDGPAESAKAPLKDVLYPAKAGGLPRRYAHQQPQSIWSMAVDQIPLQAFSGPMSTEVPAVTEPIATVSSSASGWLMGPATPPNESLPRRLQTPVTATHLAEARKIYNALTFQQATFPNGLKLSVKTSAGMAPVVGAPPSSAAAEVGLRPKKMAQLASLLSTEMIPEAWTAPADLSALQARLEMTGEVNPPISSPINNQSLGSLSQDGSDESLNADCWLANSLLKKQLSIQALGAFEGAIQDEVEALGGLGALANDGSASGGMDYALAAALAGEKARDLEAVPGALDMTGLEESALLPPWHGSAGEVPGKSIGAIDRVESQTASSVGMKRPWDVYMGLTIPDADELSKALGVGMTGQKPFSWQEPAAGRQEIESLMMDSSKPDTLAAGGAGSLKLQQVGGRAADLVPEGSCPVPLPARRRVLAKPQNYNMPLDIAALEKQAAEEALLRTAGYLPPLTLPHAQAEHQGDGASSPSSVDQQMMSSANLPLRWAHSAVEGNNLQRMGGTTCRKDHLQPPQVADSKECAFSDPVETEAMAAKLESHPVDESASLLARGEATHSGTSVARQDEGRPSTPPAGKTNTGDSAAREGGSKNGETKTKTRTKGGKPRPKDRQAMQDHNEVLRTLIPDTDKCSIDKLYEKTILHLKFLQEAVQQHETLLEIESACNVPKRQCLEDALADSRGLDPYSITTLPGPANHMLIEVLCDAQEMPLELADGLRRLGLTIRKGTMDVRNGKFWARYIVELARAVEKSQVIWLLVEFTKRYLPDGGTSARSQSPAGSAIMPSSTIMRSRALAQAGQALAKRAAP